MFVLDIFLVEFEIVHGHFPCEVIVFRMNAGVIERIGGVFVWVTLRIMAARVFSTALKNSEETRCIQKYLGGQQTSHDELVTIRQYANLRKCETKVGANCQATNL